MNSKLRPFATSEQIEAMIDYLARRFHDDNKSAAIREAILRYWSQTQEVQREQAQQQPQQPTR